MENEKENVVHGPHGLDHGERERGLGKKALQEAAPTRLALRPKLLAGDNCKKEDQLPKTTAVNDKDNNKEDVPIIQSYTSGHQLRSVPKPTTSIDIYCDEEFMDDDEPDATPQGASGGQVDRSFGSSLISNDSLSMIIDQHDYKPRTVLAEKDEDSLAEELDKTFDSVLSERNFKEYSKEILSYLMEIERKFAVDSSYMTRQPEINYKMRTILVDWMIEVCDEYKLHSETLFLAVGMIDRFLSNMSIPRHNFQLLGTTALFIASKYEEIYPPEIMEFVYITDDSYTKYQILNMEKFLLQVSWSTCVWTSF